MATSRFAISSPLAFRTFRLTLFLLTFVSLKLPEVLRLISRFRGVVSWTPKMRQVAKVEPCP
jgi:hypothetical protein